MKEPGVRSVIARVCLLSLGFPRDPNSGLLLRVVVHFVPLHPVCSDFKRKNFFVRDAAALFATGAVSRQVAQGDVNNWCNGTERPVCPECTQQRFMANRVFATLTESPCRPN